MGLENVAGGIDGLHLHLSWADYCGFHIICFTVCIPRCKYQHDGDIVAGQNGLYLYLSHIVYCGIYSLHVNDRALSDELE